MTTLATANRSMPAPSALIHRCPRELSPLVSIATVAEMGALVGDPARANMLVALLDDIQLTAGQLAERAGVSPQTASGHLARLRMAGLVDMRQIGRQRVHRLASQKVVQLLEAMHDAGADACGKAAALRPSGCIDIRTLRCCHDHIAGRLAVDLADKLAEIGVMGVRLTIEGSALLARWGLPWHRRLDDNDCQPCADWSEGRAHIGGALGAAMLDRSLALGWVRRVAGRRELTLTTSGERGFHRRFGIAIRAAAV